MTDYELHILDDNSTGSYMVYYRPTSLTAPTVASVSSVSSPQSGAIGSVDVTFSEPIDPSTLHDGEPESDPQRRGEPDQLRRDDHAGFADDLHDRRPHGPHRRLWQLHADRRRHWHQRLLRRRRHRVGLGIHFLGHGHQRAGRGQRGGGQSRAPEYARGFRRRRPLRADRIRRRSTTRR